MHTGAKRSARIDVYNHLILIFRLHILPGRDDQNIIYVELMEIFLPVIDPVHIFRLRLLNRSASHLDIRTHILKFSANLCKYRFLVILFFQIEADIGNSVIHAGLRKNIHKHLLFFSLTHRNIIFDLNALDSQIHEHTADKILRFRRCLYSEFIPFHTMISLIRFL